jgi:pilus assembly protein CpaE
MSAIEYEIRNPSELRNAEEAVRMADLENMRSLPRISVHAF